MSTEKVWAEHLFKNVYSLIDDKENTDVIIKVGNGEEIPSNSFVLKLNSSLIMKPSAMVDSQPGEKTHVHLESEFMESANLVKRIVRSFYTGKINLECDLKELQDIHKFAWVYRVEWILELTIQKLIIMAETDFQNFLKVYRFAQGIFCDPLQKRCLKVIDTSWMDNVTNDSINMEEMDYDLVRCISLNPTIPEIKKFELIGKWYERDTERRKQQTNQLIININLNRMSHADCSKVTDWIFGDELDLDDSTCGKVTRAVHIRMKTPDILTDPADIMNAVTEYIKGKDQETKKTAEVRKLSSNEFLTCARHFLGGDNEKFQDDICNYLKDHGVRLINEQSMPEFLSLLNSIRSEELVHHLLSFRNFRETAHWELLDYEAMLAIVEDLEVQHWKWTKLSIAMRWLLEKQGYLNDSSNKYNVIKLLSSMCLEWTPPDYRDMVLYPYLKKTFLSRDTQLTNVEEEDEYYWCSKHEGKKCVGSNADYCKAAALPAEFYTLQEDASLKIPTSKNKHFELVLKIDEDPCLTLNETNTTTGEVLKKFSFTLFDKDNCMDRFPMRTWSYDLEILRSIVTKCKNLHVMVLWYYK